MFIAEIIDVIAWDEPHFSHSLSCLQDRAFSSISIKQLKINCSSLISDVFFVQREGMLLKSDIIDFISSLYPHSSG